MDNSFLFITIDKSEANNNKDFLTNGLGALLRKNSLLSIVLLLSGEKKPNKTAFFRDF